MQINEYTMFRSLLRLLVQIPMPTMMFATNSGMIISCTVFGWPNIFVDASNTLSSITTAPFAIVRARRKEMKYCSYVTSRVHTRAESVTLNVTPDKDGRPKVVEQVAMVNAQPQVTMFAMPRDVSVSQRIHSLVLWSISAREYIA